MVAVSLALAVSVALGDGIWLNDCVAVAAPLAVTVCVVDGDGLGVSVNDADCVRLASLLLV